MSLNHKKKGWRGKDYRTKKIQDLVLETLILKSLQKQDDAWGQKTGGVGVRARRCLSEIKRQCVEGAALVFDSENWSQARTLQKETGVVSEEGVPPPSPV